MSEEKNIGQGFEPDDNESIFEKKRMSRQAAPKSPQSGTDAARPHAPKPPQSGTAAARPHAPKSPQPGTDAARPHAPKPPQSGTAAARPHAPKPPQSGTAAARPHAPKPPQPGTDAARPHAPKPQQSGTAAARPGVQKPPQPILKRPAANMPVKADAAKAQAKPIPAPVQKTAAEKSESGTVKPPETGDKSKKTNLSRAGAEMMSSAVKALIYMAIVLVISIFISIIVIRVGNDVFALVKNDEMIDITIPENTTLSDVADILHENSIIHYPSIFTFYGNLKHDDGVFIAGSYSVSPAMSYDDLRSEFKEKPITGTSWVTIPEGYTVDEIIDLLVSYGIGEKDKYIDVINNYAFDYWFVSELPANPDRHYRLEGYLFPDTYEFYNNSSEVTVVGRMLERFGEVFNADYRTKAAELGYTVDEIINIASMIEKEAGTAADYRYVSSVFHNRLKAAGTYPKMESDATVVYAIQLATGKRPDTMKSEDKYFDSPYNTYMYPGLTPGPITNPGASAIRYALYPTDTNYFYFISANNGTTYYASSWAEHDRNIALVRELNG